MIQGIGPMEQRRATRSKGSRFGCSLLKQAKRRAPKEDRLANGGEARLLMPLPPPPAAVFLLFPMTARLAPHWLEPSAIEYRSRSSRLRVYYARLCRLPNSVPLIDFRVVFFACLHLVLAGARIATLVHIHMPRLIAIYCPTRSS